MARDYFYFGKAERLQVRLPTREECDRMVAEFEARKGITRLPADWANTGTAPRNHIADMLRGRGS